MTDGILVTALLLEVIAAGGIRRRQIRRQAPGCKIELLTPDFQGQEMPLAKVIAERPDVPRQEATLQSGSGAFRDLVVAIDPGHGGKDPGAIGRRGTREKDIVLNIGLQLRDLIAATPGLTPVMTRDDDRFIPLRQRTEIARRHEADLFISVHADAFRLASAKGASVYCLSQNGASSEAARWLAAAWQASCRRKAARR